MAEEASSHSIRGTATNGRPPGPRGNLVLGSLRELERDPLRFLLRLQRDYGDVVRFRVALWPVVFVSHPRDVQHVLQANHRNYDKDTFDYRILKLLGGEGLLTSDGGFWLRQRRLVQPAFHRHRLSGLAELMIRCTVEMLDRWATLPEDEPLDVAREMMSLTLRIVGLALFSLDLSREASVVGEAFATANRYLTGRFYSPWAPPASWPTPGNRRFRAAVRRLDEVVLEIIAQRRAEPDAHEDVLSMLLRVRDEETGEAMDDRQLRDEVMTLMLAGHETTAVTLGWTWMLLSTHPTVRQRLEAELEEVLGGRLPGTDDLAQLGYTRRVIQESMRLYPPAWGLSRRAIGPDGLGSFSLEPGSVIFMSPYVTHRHPDFWENPEGFDPERFAPERSQGRHRFAYFPFGGGPRLCIGNEFALMEAQLILATAAQRYRLDLVAGRPIEPEPLITLRPRQGVWVSLQPRGSGQSRATI